MPLMLALTLVLAVYKKAAASLYLYLLFFVERTANEALKGWIARERPAINPLVHEPSYSFPSGHSMNAASMYPFIAFLLLLCIPFFKNTVARFTCGRAFSSDSSESAACISAFIT
nr:hypothetical protein [Bacillus licheniformis]